jgi:hypothetical protein
MEMPDRRRIYFILHAPISIYCFKDQGGPAYDCSGKKRKSK